MDKESESFSTRIEFLQTELKKCSKDIIDHICRLYAPADGSSTNLIHLKNDPRNAIKVLHHDVVDCLKLANDRESFNEKYLPDIENCRELIDAISQVSQVSEKINKCDEAVGDVDLIMTSRLISEMKTCIDELPAPNTEIGTGKVCTILRKEGRLINSRFQAKLRRLLNNCIMCEYGRISVNKVLSGMIRGKGEDLLLVSQSIQLKDIWMSLSSIGHLDESVHHFVNIIMNSMIKPLWKEKKAIAPQIFSDDVKAELVFDNIVRDVSLSNTSESCKIIAPPHDYFVYLSLC